MTIIHRDFSNWCDYSIWHSSCLSTSGESHGQTRDRWPEIKSNYLQDFRRFPFCQNHMLYNLSLFLGLWECWEQGSATLCLNLIRNLSICNFWAGNVNKYFEIFFVWNLNINLIVLVTFKQYQYDSKKFTYKLLQKLVPEYVFP